MVFSRYMTLLALWNFAGCVLGSANAGPYHIADSCIFSEVPHYSTADYVIDTVTEMRSLIESKIFEDLTREIPSATFQAVFTSKANQARVFEIFRNIFEGLPIIDKNSRRPEWPILQCIPHSWQDPSNIGWDCASTPGKAAYTKTGDPYEIFLCPLFFSLRETANPRFCKPRIRMARLFQNQVAALVHQLFYLYAGIDYHNMQTCAIESVSRAAIPGSIFGAGKCVPEPLSIEAVTKLDPDEQVQTAQSYALYASILSAGCDMDEFVKTLRRGLTDTNATTASEPDIPLPSDASRKVRRLEV